ncbi:hypothetical protein DPMN_104119 [Dreissena polymorpha]|uniref:Uncharacterized protein n=1 Tax=Dreissena polymorpha TaxID=45954 RepID=A0A9D4HBD0_DREPO|nr:hypothetical protein DPMN_104119 [Dreissena polymorpha]
MGGYGIWSDFLTQFTKSFAPMRLLLQPDRVVVTGMPTPFDVAVVASTVLARASI